jgi:transporter family protein
VIQSQRRPLPNDGQSLGSRASAANVPQGKGPLLDETHAKKRRGEANAVGSKCLLCRQVMLLTHWRDWQIDRYHAPMPNQSWLAYAIFAALAASLVSIFAKVGMKDIDPTLATTVRSAIMFVFLIIVCTGERLWNKLPTIHGLAITMITLSGLAGAISWLFGFKALAVGGQVTQVAPIDKLSVPLAAILAFLLLRDRPSALNWTGILLIAFGAYLTSLPRQVAPTPADQPLHSSHHHTDN